MKEYTAEQIAKVNSYLKHHGIPDQKWGVRRGPPYPLSRKQKASSGKVTVNIRNISDEDLRTIINRLQMEKQLKDLTKDEKKKGQSVARKVVGRIGNTGLDIGLDVAKKIGTQWLTYKIGTEINKKSGVDIIDLGKKKDKGK